MGIARSIVRVRALAAVTALAGVAALAIVPAIDLPGRASSGKAIQREFANTMSPAGLTALQSTFHMIDAFGTQFVGQTLPGLERELKLTPAQMDTLLRTKFPATWRGVQEIPGALALVRPVVPRIVAMAADYRAVTRIPGFGLPLRSVTWLVLLLGAGLLIVGTAAFLLPGRVSLAALAAVGVLAVAIPLAMGLPAKFDAGTRVVAVADVALSQHAATVAETTTHVVDNLVAEVDRSLIPALAKDAHQSRAAFTRSLAAAYPAVATGLREWSSVRASGYALAAAQQASVKPFRDDISDLPLGALPWLVIGPAAALALLALAALTLEARLPSELPRELRRPASAAGDEAASA